jgi:hypothetical protein
MSKGQASSIQKYLQRFKSKVKESMYLAHAAPVSAPSSFFALAHIHLAQALRGLLPPFSFSSSSSSRQQKNLKATSMEIEQRVELQINYF